MTEFSGWLRQLPVEQVQAEVAALEQQKAHLDREIQVRLQAIALVQAVGPERLTNGHSERREREARDKPSERPPTAASIRTIMESNPDRPWKLSELHAEMIRRGWAKAGRVDSSRIHLAARRMAEKGEVARPTYGYYQLSQAAESEDPLGRPWGSLVPQFRFSNVAGNTVQSIPSNEIKID